MWGQFLTTRTVGAASVTGTNHAAANAHGEIHDRHVPHYDTVLEMGNDTVMQWCGRMFVIGV